MVAFTPTRARVSHKKNVRRVADRENAAQPVRWGRATHARAASVAPSANTVNGAQTFGAAAARPGARHRTTQTRPPALRAAPAASHGDGDLGSEGEEHGRGLLEVVADPGVGEAGHHRPVDDAVVGRPAHLGEDEAQVSTRGVGPSPPPVRRGLRGVVVVGRGREIAPLASPRPRSPPLASSRGGEGETRRSRGGRGRGREREREQPACTMGKNQAKGWLQELKVNILSGYDNVNVNWSSRG